jgi:hypothetical protein
MYNFAEVVTQFLPITQRVTSENDECLTTKRQTAYEFELKKAKNHTHIDIKKLWVAILKDLKNNRMVLLLFLFISLGSLSKAFNHIRHRI